MAEPNLDRSRSLVGWGVWLAIPLAVFVALCFHAFELRLMEVTQQLPAYKFTFIAVLLALGTFQYNFLYAIAERYRQSLDNNDFGLAWNEYMRNAQALAAKILENQTHTDVGQWQAQLAEMNRVINANIEWHRRTLRNVLLEGCVRFMLIFSVAFSLLISLSLDVVKLLHIPMRFDSALLSQSFLLGAIFLFWWLLLFYMLALSLELWIRMGITRPQTVQ